MLLRMSAPELRRLSHDLKAHSENLTKITKSLDNAIEHTDWLSFAAISLKLNWWLADSVQLKALSQGFESWSEKCERSAKLTEELDEPVK
jgi:hypothetical protein